VQMFSEAFLMLSGGVEVVREVRIWGGRCEWCRQEARPIMEAMIIQCYILNIDYYRAYSSMRTLLRTGPAPRTAGEEEARVANCQPEHAEHHHESVKPDKVALGRDDAARPALG
jgi:hypothetical protein